MAGGSLMRGWCSLMSDFRWLAAGLINPTDDFNHDNHDISQESFLLLKILCLHPHPGLYQYLYLYLYQYLYPHPYLYPYLNTFYIYTKSISVFLSVSIPISTSIPYPHLYLHLYLLAKPAWQNLSLGLEAPTSSGSTGSKSSPGQKGAGTATWFQQICDV